MTVREFINEILNFDMEEDIEFYINDGEMVPIEFACDPTLPYIKFELKGRVE